MNLNTLELLLIYGLAVWRLSYMLTDEDGPFELFNGLRWLAGVRWIYSEKPGVLPVKTSWVDLHWFDKPHWVQAIVKTPYGIFDCLYCMSIWVSALFLALHLWLPQVADILAIWLALSTIAIYIKEKLI